MAKSPEKFADLLNQALNRIKKSGQPKEMVKTTIAHAIGKGVDLIEHWQRGNCPATYSQTEIVAKILFTKRGLINKEEFELFLDYAGHPSPAVVWNTFSVKVDGPSADAFNIFIGRAEKIDELCKVLRPGRVVLMWGAGGVGKTSLVRAVIQKLAHNNSESKQFPHGILYYEFSDQEHNANDAFRYIARFFGIEVTLEMSPRDAASEALKDKRALIVLDGAEEADDLRKIWRVRAQCGLLIVSRYDYLDLSDQTIYLDILPPDEAIAALRSWSIDEANHSDFQVWSNTINADDQTARDICEELGRLPLALRLAGRYMLHRRVRPSKFLKLWREWRLSLFQEGKHQHDSLQVLIKKSLEQVEHESEDAREIMAVAGLLSYQPFSTEVVTAALEKAASVVEKILRDLWKFSLIKQVSSEHWQVAHRLIYTYAQSLNTRAELTTRMAAYYTHLAKEQSKQDGEGYARLNAEHAHIMAILEDCLKQKNWTSAHDLAWASAEYLPGQGRWMDLSRVSEIGLAAARALNDRQAETRWLSLMGVLYTQRLGLLNQVGSIKQGIEYIERGVTLAREIGDKRSETNLLAALGHAHAQQQQWEPAFEYWIKAFEDVDKLDIPVEEAHALLTRAEAHMFSGQLNKTIECYQQALAILHEPDNHTDEGSRQQWRAFILTLLGCVYEMLGETKRAIEYFEQALAIFRELNHRYGESIVLSGLSLMYSKLGQLIRAIEYCEQALPVIRETGNRTGEATCLEVLAGAYINTGQKELATTFLKQATDIAHESGNRRAETNLLVTSAFNFISLGRFEEAIKVCQDASELDPDDSLLQSLIALCWETLGNLNKATYHYLRQIKLPPYADLNAYVSLGVITKRQGMEAEAKKFFDIALSDEVRESALLNDLNSSASLLEAKAIALLCLGQEEKANFSLQQALDQRRPDEPFNLIRYSLLAAAPNPPKGLDKMWRTVADAFKIL